MIRASVATLAGALLCACATGVAPTAAPPAPPRLAEAPRPPVVLEGEAVQGGLVRGTVPPGVRRLSLTAGQAALPIEVPIGDDGRFIIGFDRDAGAAATLLAVFVDGSVATTPLAVASRAWRIERVDAPLRAGRTTAEFDRLRPIELTAIAAARAPDPTRPDPGGWRTPLAWPGQGRVSGLFGAQRIYRGVPGSYHSGIDLALPAGTPVVAPADGIVTLAADRSFTLEGRLLLVDHGGGLESAFLHLSRIDVAAGQRVRRGQPIGLVGATGRATGPHLHWGLRWRGARLDPLLIAEPMSR